MPTEIVKARKTETKTFLFGVRSRKGGKYCTPPKKGRCTDCSGLVCEEYTKATKRVISCDSHTLFADLPAIERAHIRAGDLAFWNTGFSHRRGNSASHVGVIMENGKVINALNESRGIIESELDANYGGPLLGFRRLPWADSVGGEVEPPATTTNVSRQTNFRQTGNTDFASFQKALARTVTQGRIPPPLSEARAIYASLLDLGLTRIAAGMAWIERSNETNDADLVYYGRDLHNLWAVKNPPAEQPSKGAWRRYGSYQQAADEWGPLILGATYSHLTSIADFIGFYAPWSDGNNPDQYGARLVNEINALPLLDEGTEPPPQPQPGFRTWTIPGLGTIRLPDSITVETVLTPVGVHRPGRVVTMTGSTLHETGNRGQGAGARMHSNWQDSCTPGHPDGYVGVTMYVEDRLVIVKIPLNESSIHSGDWRNNAHPSMEVCVNADRNAEQTEDTAMWVQAAILHARGQNALDHLYPHHSGSGCPAIINGQGRWPQIEKGVDDRIAMLKSGGTPPPPAEYAKPVPVPKVWDGTDYVRDSDGHRFYAVQRVFVAARKTTPRQSASANAPAVRRDLEIGEAFTSHYVTQGEGGMWIVSQYGSRIRAADCNPRLGVLVAGVWVGDTPEPDSLSPVINDEDRGLDASIVPDDAPSMTKADFMAEDEPVEG